MHDCLITWFAQFYSSNYSLKWCRLHLWYSAISPWVFASEADTHTSTVFRDYVYELHQTLTQFMNQMLCSLSPIMKEDILVLWQNTKSQMCVLLTGKNYRWQRILTFWSNLTWGHQIFVQIYSYLSLGIIQPVSLNNLCLY